MRPGQLYRTKKHTVSSGRDFCQVIDLYAKRDIDPDCHLSIEIVDMVKAVWLTGEMQGKVFTTRAKTFRYRWEVVNDA